jgi:hypothetical protein
MDAELAGLVAGRRHHATRAGVGAHCDDDRLAAQLRAPEQLHGDVEGVHVDVGDDAATHGSNLGGGGDGQPAYDLGMASPESKNLEAISKAIDRHNASCPFPASEVRMSPFEVERLGWDEIRGLPVVADPALGTGRFRIVCSQEGDGSEIEEIEAIGEPVEVER